MKPRIGAYTVAMPWYDEADFHRLWTLAHDRDEIPPSYSEWRTKAEEVLRYNLAHGLAIQIVTIRPEPFLAWLQESGLENTAAARLKYVEQLACGSATRLLKTG